MTKPKLPKTLFIRYADPNLSKDDDNQYLIEFRELYASAVPGVEHTVGVYELKEIKKVTLGVLVGLVEKP